MKIVWVFELKTFPLSFVSLLLFGSLVRSECVWVYARVSVLTKKRVSDWQCVVWWPTKVSNLTLDVLIRLPWVKTMSSPSLPLSLSILVMEWWAFHWFWFHYYYFDVKLRERDLFEEVFARRNRQDNVLAVTGKGKEIILENYVKKRKGDGMACQVQGKKKWLWLSDCLHSLCSSRHVTGACLKVDKGGSSLRWGPEEIWVCVAFKKTPNRTIADLITVSLWWLGS